MTPPSSTAACLGSWLTECLPKELDKNCSNNPGLMMESRAQLSSRGRKTKTAECDRMMQSHPKADNTSYLNRLPVIKPARGSSQGLGSVVQESERGRLWVGHTLYGG